jgi:hypothetical protein
MNAQRRNGDDQRQSQIKQLRVQKVHSKTSPLKRDLLLLRYQYNTFHGVIKRK